MTTLRYETKIAKRDHKTTCEMSGVPIEKGDRFFEGAWVDGRDLFAVKTHAILHDMVEESMNRNGEDTWNPNEVCDYLIEWLEHHLQERVLVENPDPTSKNYFDEWPMPPEVEACYEAAREFWKASR